MWSAFKNILDTLFKNAIQNIESSTKMDFDIVLTTFKVKEVFLLKNFFARLEEGSSEEQLEQLRDGLNLNQKLSHAKNEFRWSEYRTHEKQRNAKILNHINNIRENSKTLISSINCHQIPPRTSV